MRQHLVRALVGFPARSRRARQDRRSVPSVLRLENFTPPGPVFMVDQLANLYTESVDYDVGTLGGQYADGDGAHGDQSKPQGFGAAANGAANARYDGPPGPVSGMEAAVVRADFQGPFQTGFGGPTQTAQVIIAVTHSHIDEIWNQGTDALSFAQSTAYAQTDSGGGYALTIQNGGFGADLEIHFHAHFDNTQTVPFQSDPHLILNVGNLMTFTVDPDSGYMATADDGTPLDADPSFGTSTDPGHDVDFDLPGVQVPDGPLDVNYMSSLYSHVTDAFAPPGVDRNDSHFTWSLTLTVT
jgi:hypothetical protein